MAYALAIINSVHLERKSPAYCRQLVDGLRSIPGCDIRRTTAKNEAIEIAALNRDNPVIIAAGGDGTVHEIVNGMDLERQTLGIIPFGTCNTFAKQFGINDIKTGLDAILDGNTLSCDLIKINAYTQRTSLEKYMIETSAIGYLADAVRTANRHLKGLGELSYTAASLLHLGDMGRFTMEMTIGTERSSMYATNFVLNNVPYLADYRLFDDARIDDGLFDYALTHLSGFGQLNQSLSLFFGKPVPGILMQGQAESLTARMFPEQRLMIDGETFDDIQEASFLVSPGALKLFTPK